MLVIETKEDKNDKMVYYIVISTEEKNKAWQKENKLGVLNIEVGEDLTEKEN